MLCAGFRFSSTMAEPGVISASCWSAGATLKNVKLMPSATGPGARPISSADTHATPWGFSWLRRLGASGGTGPSATGVLVTGGSFANVVNTTVNSGSTVGAGKSAYGVRALGLSVVNVTLSEITAQPGVAGTAGTASAPGQAASGNGWLRPR